MICLTSNAASANRGRAHVFVSGHSLQIAALQQAHRARAGALAPLPQPVPAGAGAPTQAGAGAPLLHPIAHPTPHPPTPALSPRPVAELHSEEGGGTGYATFR